MKVPCSIWVIDRACQKLVTRATFKLYLVWYQLRHQMKTFSALLVICAGNSPVRFMGELQSAILIREYPKLYVYSHAILYTWYELLTSMAFGYYMRTRDGVCNPYIPYGCHISIILWSFRSELFQEWKCHARYGSLIGHAKLLTRATFKLYLVWYQLRHQMKAFSALLVICAGNSLVPGEFPAQRPVTRSFDVFFDLRLNKRLSKQSWGWWFETLSHPSWRHRNDVRGTGSSMI